MAAPIADETPTLIRGLGLLDATMIVVGSMIGSGIFITSAESARLVGSPGWLMAAWLLAGLLTVTGALCCAELSAMMPNAGGQYVFLREAYGRPLGFLFGWSQFLVVGTGTIAAVAVAFAKFLGVLTPWVSETRHLLGPLRIGTTGYALSLSTQQLVAMAMIGLLTLSNTRGLKTGKWIQNTFTFAKTSALIALIVIGLGWGWNQEAAAWSSSWWNPEANDWSPETAQPGLGAIGALGLVLLLGKAMIGPLFSQTAWNSVTFTGGEVRDPGRVLPRALVLGTTSVVVLYLLANMAYLVTLPFAEIQQAPQDRVGTATMNTILGRPGVLAMALAILISTFGCNNGLILCGARVYYAMARDHLFFARIGTANRRHVPAAALVAQGFWAAFLTLPRTIEVDSSGTVTYGNVYSQLLEFVISADITFSALMVGAVVILRRTMPLAERPYRTPGYPLPAIVYIALAVLLILDLIILAPRTSGMGFALVLTGVPVYALWRRSSKTIH